MSRRPALVTQADVARALRAAEQCREPRVVEITPEGIIRIVPASDRSPTPETYQPLDDDSPIEL